MQTKAEKGDSNNTEFDLEAIKGRLVRIAKKDHAAVVLFAARNALRVLPWIATEDGLQFKENLERHTLAVWRGIWLAWNPSAAADGSALYAHVSIAARNAARDAVRDAARSRKTAPSVVYAVRVASSAADAAAADAAARGTRSIDAAAYAAARAARSAVDAYSAVAAAADAGLQKVILGDLASLELGENIRTYPLWPQGFLPDVAIFERQMVTLGYEGIVDDYRALLNGDVAPLIKQPWDRYESLWEKVKVEDQKEDKQAVKKKVAKQAFAKKAAAKDAESKDKPAQKKIESEFYEESDSQDSDSINEDVVVPSLSQRYQYNPHTRLQSEGPASEDHLDREPLAAALARWLTEPNNKEHITLGLFGDWGVGKSTFVNLLKHKLPQKKSDSEHVEFIVGEFNAWSYEHSGNIQAGLAQEFVNAIVGDLNPLKKFWLACRFAWKQHPWRISLIVLLLLALLSFLMNKEAIELFGVGAQKEVVWGVNLALFSGFSVFAYQQAKQVFSHPLAKELKTYLRLPDFGEHLGTIPVMREQIKTLANLRLNHGKNERRLLFVVDDLDRCSPEGVVKTFEAVRLAMDLEKVIVIIAIDQKIALASLALHYEDLSKHHNADPVSIARDYLGKVVHLPITLEAPSSDSVAYYLDEYLWKDHEQLEDELPEGKDEGLHVSIARPSELEVSTSNMPASSRVEHVDGNLDVAVSITPVEPVEPVEPVAPVESGSLEQEAIPEQPIKQLTGLSAAQRDMFKRWVAVLNLANPRQLKRLDNAYTLIRHRYPDEDMQEQCPRLKVLLWLEYLNELPICTRQQVKGWLEGLVLADKVILDKTFLPAVIEGMNTMDEERILKTAYQQVKGFVLPAIENEVD